MDVRLSKTNALPLSGFAHELVGADHGGIGICVIFVDARPGEGPSLHRHPYEEIFITLEGEATVTSNEQEFQIGPGDIVIVPPHTPHAFTNSGSVPLRQIDIHVSPTFSTEWR
jgi:mannose-6-phosphate isomerase-like protein (cupin superfamily)